MRQLIRKIAFKYLRALHSDRALEVWLSLFAVSWGVAVMGAGQLMVNGSSHLVDALVSVKCVLAFPPIAIGIAGLWAVHKGWRWLRALSSFAAVLVWGLLSYLFFSMYPPVSTVAVGYGMVALGEAWTYVRTSGRFDDGPA